MKKDSFPSHADFIRQSDEIKRRQKRLLEVREQSKKMTSVMLERMKTEAENQYRNTENQLLCKIRDQHFKELAAIRKEYEQCIYNVNRKCYDEIIADKSKITTPSVKKVSALKKQPDVNKGNPPEQIQDNRIDLNLQSYVSSTAGHHTYGKTCRKMNKSNSNMKSIEACHLPECIVMDSDDNINEEVTQTIDLPSAECASKYRLNVMYYRLVHDRIRILEQKEKVLRRRIPSLQKGDAVIKRNKPSRYCEHLLKNRVKSVSGDRVDKAVNTDEKTECSTSHAAPRSQSLSPSPSSSFSSTVTEKKKDYLDNVIKDMKRLNIKKKLLTAELCDMNATVAPVTAIMKNKTEELRNLYRKSKGMSNDVESGYENSIKNETLKQSILRQNNDKEVFSVNDPTVGTGVRTENMTFDNSKRVHQSSVSSNRAEDEEIECDDKLRCALNEIKIPENVDSKVRKPLRKHSQMYVHKTKDIVVTVHTGKKCNDVTAVDGVEIHRLLDNHQEGAIGQNVSSSMSSFNGSVHYDPKENTENIKVTVNVLATSTDDNSEYKNKKKRTVNEHEKRFHVSRKEKHLIANKVSNWRTVFENSEKLTESSYFSPPPSTALPAFPVSLNNKVDFISPSNNSHNDTDATENSSVDDIGYYVAKLLLMSPESIENLNSVSITSQSEDLNEQVDAYKNDNKHSKLSTVYATDKHHHRRRRHHHKHYGFSSDHNFHGNKMPTKKVSSRSTEIESKRCQDKQTTRMHDIADHLNTEFNNSGRGNCGGDSNADDRNKNEPDFTGKSENVRSLLIKYLQAAAVTSTTDCQPVITADNKLSPMQSPRQLQRNAEKRKRRERKPVFVNKKLAYYANSFEEPIDVSSSTSVGVSASDVSGLCVVDKPDTNFIPERHAESNTNTNTNGSSPMTGINCSSAAAVNLKGASIDTTPHAAMINTTTTKPAISAIGTSENNQKKDEVDVRVEHVFRSSLPLIGLETSNEDQEISFSSVEAMLKQNMKWLSTGSEKPLTVAEVSMPSNESNEIFDVEELMRGWLKINYPKNQNLDDDADAIANVGTYDNMCVRPDDSHSVAERNIVAEGSTNYSTQLIGTNVQVSELAAVVDKNINDQFCDDILKSSNDIKRKSRLLRWMGSTMQRTLEASAVNSSSSFEEFGKAID